MSASTNLIEYFICGGFGGICTVLVGHPLDTVKVRLQTMPMPKPGEKPMYTGTLNCFKTTIQNEGVRGLYKGMGAPLIAITPIFALSFMGYGLGRKICALRHKEEFTYLDYFLAGAFSGAITSIIMSPGERIKSLLQVQQGANAPKIYNGPIDCGIKLFRQGGIGSIYRGLGATICRDVPAAGSYFLTYEVFKDVLSGYDSQNLGVIMIAGGMAGIANWLAGMPADVLKSRLQTAPEGTYPNGMRDVFFKLMREEGPLALYKGLTPVMLRAFPANAACFLGFEMCNSFIQFLKNIVSVEL